MFAFLLTPRFYLILFVGQMCAACTVSSSTFTTLLQQHGASLPAFQNFPNYFLMNLVYGGYTIYKYGWKKWARMIWTDGWKYLIFSFFDVQGNYFVVLAYQYTTLLSGQLISFWAIVLVVIISFFVLKVRYHWSQIVGILICCGGMGVLIYNDNMGGSGHGVNELKGDMFMLVSASCYGLSNVLEEFLVSKKPLYEVIGQIGFWGMIINGTQTAIFDRKAFSTINWDGKTGGYIIGYSLSLFIFYTLVPILLRMASAAFLNISLLTANFWIVVIGTRLFNFKLGRLYPAAFVMIMVGLLIYYLLSSFLGEATKPWLGEDQQKGVSGIGTAKRKLAKHGVAGTGVESV
ncbi:DUF914-domain-containing protein [Ascobolus immersus RN42]|uniref:DUF914-domain-containing protein n=1 Tax=Ascobolus immersus RN42 TaxID=1160509 RepID=A0A3N4I6X3_ASCIM|nr:DUF914-domain-containing protein [Ascobolus immersus RN42]